MKTHNIRMILNNAIVRQNGIPEVYKSGSCLAKANEEYHYYYDLKINQITVYISIRVPLNQVHKRLVDARREWIKRHYQKFELSVIFPIIEDYFLEKL